LKKEERKVQTVLAVQERGGGKRGGGVQVQQECGRGENEHREDHFNGSKGGGGKMTRKRQKGGTKKEKCGGGVTR